jgi:N-acetylglucosamine-6-sulfatase
MSQKISPSQRRMIILLVVGLLVAVGTLASAKSHGAKHAKAIATTSTEHASAEPARGTGAERDGGDPTAKAEWAETGAGAQAAKAQATAAESRRPNIVFILSDDQTASAFSAKKMPRTRKALGRHGMTFTDSIAAPPLCCPYRAAFLGGQYAHNNGVNKNRPGYGALVDPDLVLPVFLRGAGYRTAFVGKFLNGSTASLGRSPAPGWDHWFGMSSPPRYQNAEFSVNGRLRTFGRRSQSSQVMTGEARSFIRRESRTRAPFFLWLAHFAPHPSRERTGTAKCAGQRTAKPRAKDFRFAKRFSFPRSGNFNKRDRSKPSWVTDNPRLGADERRTERRKWHCMLAASQQVDRSVVQIVRQLRQSGELANTWIVFGSDNGFQYGEHRIRGKRGTYEEMLRVPLVIRPPAEPRFKGQRGKRNSTLVSQVDLAATIVDIARAEPCVNKRCRVLDGQNLVPLLRGARPSWARGDRAVPIRLRGCQTMAIRTSTRLSYIETRAGGNNQCASAPVNQELYDVRRDRGQTNNLVPDPRVRELRRRLATLQRCSGVAERPSLIQPGRPHCE